MTANLLKVCLAGTVVFSAVAYLASAGMKDGSFQYHVQVDDFLKNSQIRSQRVRLAGKVAEQGVVLGAGRLNASFVLEGQTGHVPVSYAGIVPDLFKAGCDVVVEGRLDAQGTFKADLMMTKCASKYDAKDSADRGKGNGHRMGHRNSDNTSNNTSGK